MPPHAEQLLYGSKPGGGEAGWCWFPGAGAGFFFSNPAEVLIVHRLEEVLPSLSRVEAWTAAGGWAAGFIAYEAACAFEPAVQTHDPEEDLPLLWFGLFTGPGPAPPMAAASYRVGPWRAGLTQTAYEAAAGHVREHIAAGDTYQVNLTFPMEADFEGDARTWFEDLFRAQRSPHAAYIDAGRFKILSLSPELFFDLDGTRITARPMKGTRPRGRWAAEDERLARELGDSRKDRAENVMIVDLLRNDLGRVSEPGSVCVDRLFEVERYDTVWQMTSSISARSAASMADIFAALFPCGSVTGAPKIMTTRIIRSLEAGPRGVYCGAVGWWGPNRRASFNVGIRTVLVDSITGRARYHVGSGLTWDSVPSAEYQECLDKAAVLQWQQPEFQLLETLRWERVFHLLDEHLDRMRASALYFGWPFDEGELRRTLEEALKDAAGPKRVRLLLDRRGTFRVETFPAPETRPLRVGFARDPVDSSSRFLYHKTTFRDVYEGARSARPDCDDVLLWNERGEITEGTFANVVLELDGAKVTPPLASGLLPGILRGRLLKTGEIAERVLLKSDVGRADAIWLINSLRGWIPILWRD